MFSAMACLLKVRGLDLKLLWINILSKIIEKQLNIDERVFSLQGISYLLANESSEFSPHLEINIYSDFSKSVFDLVPLWISKVHFLLLNWYIKLVRYVKVMFKFIYECVKQVMYELNENETVKTKKKWEKAQPKYRGMNLNTNERKPTNGHTYHSKPKRYTGR